MRFFRRSLIALGVAASLPTFLFAAVGAYVVLREESRRIEEESLERAQFISSLIDARLRSDAQTLTILTGSTLAWTRQWEAFYERLERVIENIPHWSTVAVYDAQTGAAVFDIRYPWGAPGIPGMDSGSLQKLQANGQPLVGNVSTFPEPLAWIYTPIRSEDGSGYVLAAAVRPDVFQELIARYQPGGRPAIVALVDANGVFVARSLDPQRLIGAPVTNYMKKAIETAPEGFYRYRTYEGVSAHSAYHTSDWSGWSTHIAIDSSVVDAPISWSFVVATAAGLGGAALAVLLAVLVLRDMAERRRAEDMLRQSQKMEAIGQLTGGIAHDFNNLLTAIIGNLDLIRTRAAGNERLQRLAENALEAARRGAKISSQLLAFSRNQRMQLAPVSVSALLQGMSDLLAQSVGPAIQLRKRIDPDADLVLSDANQLELALLNLAVNARDAMPNGGSIEIEVRPAPDRDVRGLPKRPYVEIAVKDTGIGMPESVRMRAMEPFFTTKPVGQGTGLGLSQVYGIVRESGGLVLIDSAPNKGTTVRLILPAAPPTAIATNEKADTSPTVPTPLAESTARILVVDDDRQVRRFIAQALRMQGYAVSDVATPSSCLMALRESRFDLLIADFAMPEMNGADLIREARRIQPELRVLVASGYADSAALTGVLGEACVLRKPFAVAELSAAVAAMLATDPETA
jgi:signal transduction histidine kinase/CheY-like chemotaxis protein